MRLTELYAQTPVSKHGDILVSGDRVYVSTPEGTEEYLLGPDEELRLLRSDRQLRADIARIKEKVEALRQV